MWVSPSALSCLIGLWQLRETHCHPALCFPFWEWSLAVGLGSICRALLQGLRSLRAPQLSLHGAGDSWGQLDWKEKEEGTASLGSDLGGDEDTVLGAAVAGLEVPRRQHGAYSSLSAFICCLPSRAMQSVRVCSGIGRSWDVQNCAALLTGLSACLLLQAWLRWWSGCCSLAVGPAWCSTRPACSLVGLQQMLPMPKVQLCAHRVTAPH